MQNQEEIRSQCYNHNSNGEKQTERKCWSFHKEGKMQFAGGRAKGKSCFFLCKNKKENIQN